MILLILILCVVCGVGFYSTVVKPFYEALTACKTDEQNRRIKQRAFVAACRLQCR